MALEYSENTRFAQETLQNIKRAILMLQEWNEGVESADEWLSSTYGMQKLAGNAMMIEVIGEEVKKVEKRMGMEFLNQRPEIPWRDVMGMRNHIAHGYFDINELYVFSVIKNDLAPLLEAINYLISLLETLRIEKEVDEHIDKE
jgi:uncharacterized protein with HEPN domain